MYVTDEEHELEDLLNYERYRALVENELNSVSEEQWVTQVATELDDKLVPTQQEYYQEQQEQSEGHTKSKQTEPGVYAAVGFSYGGPTDEDFKEKPSPKERAAIGGGGGGGEELEAEEERAEKENQKCISSRPANSSTGDASHLENRGGQNSASGPPSTNELALRYNISDYVKLRALDQREQQRNEAHEKTKKGKQGLSRKDRRKMKEYTRDQMSPSERDTTEERHSRGRNCYNRRGSPTYEDYRPPPGSVELRDDRSSSTREQQKIEYITEIPIVTTTEGKRGAQAGSLNSWDLERNEPINIESLGSQVHGKHARSIPDATGHKRPATAITPSTEKKKLTPQERLKKALQLQLSKQIKSDRKEEKKKKEEKRTEERQQRRSRDIRSRSRSRSRSRIRSHRRSRSRSRSSSRSRKRSRSRDRGRSRSPASKRRR